MGWVFVNPKTKAPVEEAERRFKKRGWIGVKAHPFWHRYPVDALDDVASLCQQLGKPMLVHLGGGFRNGDFRRLPHLFPRLKLIYAHAGIPWFRRLWEDAPARQRLRRSLQPLPRQGAAAPGAAGAGPFALHLRQRRALRLSGARRRLRSRRHPAPDPAGESSRAGAGSGSRRQFQRARFGVAGRRQGWTSPNRTACAAFARRCASS
jgi:amidohydrolase family protein